MTAASIGSLVGTILVAIVLTRFVSRLPLWLSKKWDGGKLRLILAHAASGIVCGWGFAGSLASHGDLDYPTMMAIYALAQLFWLARDWRRYDRQVAAAAQAAAPQ